MELFYSLNRPNVFKYFSVFTLLSIALANVSAEYPFTATLTMRSNDARGPTDISFSIMGCSFSTFCETTLPI